MNAAEAIGNDQGEIRISTRLVEVSGDSPAGYHLAPTAGWYVRLAISDTGPGIGMDVARADVRSLLPAPSLQVVVLVWLPFWGSCALIVGRFAVETDRVRVEPQWRSSGRFGDYRRDPFRSLEPITMSPSDRLGKRWLSMTKCMCEK